MEVARLKPPLNEEWKKQKQSRLKSRGFFVLYGNGNQESPFGWAPGFCFVPLLKKAKSVYTDDADMLFLLKYHITSVVDSIEATIEIFEREQKQ